MKIMDENNFHWQKSRSGILNELFFQKSEIILVWLLDTLGYYRLNHCCKTLLELIFQAKFSIPFTLPSKWLLLQILNFQKCTTSLSSPSALIQFQKCHWQKWNIIKVFCIKIWSIPKGWPRSEGQFTEGSSEWPRRL